MIDTLDKEEDLTPPDLKEAILLIREAWRALVLTFIRL